LEERKLRNEPESSILITNSQIKSNLSSEEHKSQILINDMLNISSEEKNALLSELNELELQNYSTIIEKIKNTVKK